MSGEKIFAILLSTASVVFSGIIVYMTKRNATKYLNPENENNPLLIPTAAGAVNNPGNIRKSSTTFTGEIASISAGFKSFSEMKFGYRAMIKLLRYYKSYYGDVSFWEMINRYAPPSDDNPTTDYAEYVAQYAGINLYTDAGIWLYSDKVKKVVEAMSRFEQGNDFTPDIAAINEAFLLV